MARAQAPAIFALTLLVTALWVGCGPSDTARQPATTAARQPAPQPVRGPALARPNNTKALRARHLVDELASAGLETEEMGPAEIHLDDLSRFPEEPRSTLLLRVSDGEGNASPMTFVEFGSWKAAAEVDTKPINGFAVRNWFVLGTVNKYFVGRVTEALDG